MPLNLPLMRNNISRVDLDEVIDYLNKDNPILTQSTNVKSFEKEWSDWLGVKHSVFVNSGSSANQLTMAALRLRYPEGGDVIIPPLTWSSDIASVLQAGFNPVFVDIDPWHLGMDTQEVLAALNEQTRAVFLTHVQGFNALTDELLSILQEREILLIEDVCESHGATHNGQKLGSFGWASNFSFYYAHHMSTIEGGMICTNDSRSLRDLSHAALPWNGAGEFLAGIEGSLLEKTSRPESRLHLCLSSLQCTQHGDRGNHWPQPVASAG